MLIPANAAMRAIFDLLMMVVPKDVFLAAR
jgi:hypothetical protein